MHRQRSECGGYRPIEDYAIIGNGRAAGLVSRDGSLDWLCLPRFDSPSIFGALLDANRGGRWQIKPVGDFRVERCYARDSNILETTFITGTGTIVLRDGMSVSSERDKRSSLLPEHEILREVEGIAGAVEVELCYEPRPQYGRERPPISDRGLLGFWCETHGGSLVLQSELPLRIAPDGGSVAGRAWVEAGERHYLSLAFDADAPAVILPLGAAAHERHARSVRWWQDWARKCRYDGPYREAVIRSALALKLMTFAPSGAIIAAPTTSLPERMGGSDNWDYRYCWLRDASFTVRALLSLGYIPEGEAFINWLLHATRLTWPELQVLYEVHGEASIPEQELDHLEGYQGSRPVRVGNDAYGQLQLDGYGDVIDAATRFARLGGAFDRDTTRLLEGLGRTVCKRWQEPDEGIWEGRSGRFHHTHSKVLCWVALDRLIELHDRHALDLSVDTFRRTRADIRAAVEEHGYNEELGSYTRLFDGDDFDASLLTLPLYGYIDATHPRMQSTCARIHDRLATGSLVYRYERSIPSDQSPGEGAFGICSFWAVECRARRGDVHGASRAFEQLLLYANDVGLFAEEVDPATGRALGNVPQAFTHIGLINAALTLAECEGEDEMYANRQSLRRTV